MQSIRGKSGEASVPAESTRADRRLGLGHVGSAGLKAERNPLRYPFSPFLHWLCLTLTSINCSYRFV